jgi:hypothetical protein
MGRYKEGERSISMGEEREGWRHGDDREDGEVG